MEWHDCSVGFSFAGVMKRGYCRFDGQGDRNRPLRRGSPGTRPRLLLPWLCGSASFSCIGRLLHNPQSRKLIAEFQFEVLGVVVCGPEVATVGELLLKRV